MEHTYTPLAEKLRPQRLSDVIGQEHLTAKDGILTLIAKSKPTSLILWGPPGTGKTRTPDLYTIMQILGRDRVSNRLK